MAIQFEDLLSIVCPGFELGHATDFQKHYQIRDEKDAKLAFDILVSYGFDAKLYRDEQNNTAKLYITMPAADADPAVMEQRLFTAIAYGKALKDVKQRLDTLCHEEAEALQSPSYTLTFANAAQGGKQIVIAIQSAVASQQAQALAQPVMAPRPPSQPAQANRPAAKKMVKKKEDDGFNQGPAIAKQLYTAPGKKKAEEPDNWRRQLFLYVTGNMATGGAGIIMAAVLLFVLFSFFILAKGFLCPDFAVEKKDVNRAWYCEDASQPQKESQQLPAPGNIR